MAAMKKHHFKVCPKCRKQPETIAIDGYSVVRCSNPECRKKYEIGVVADTVTEALDKWDEIWRSLKKHDYKKEYAECVRCDGRGIICTQTMDKFQSLLDQERQILESKNLDDSDIHKELENSEYSKEIDKLVQKDKAYIPCPICKGTGGMILVEFPGKEKKDENQLNIFEIE